MLRKNVVHTL